MNSKDILDNIINNILEVKLIYKDIMYKLENDGVYIYLFTIKKHSKEKSIIYYDKIESAIAYLHGIRKTLYLLELEKDI